MNTSKFETAKTPTNQNAKKEKNIREIYLQALNHGKKSLKKTGVSHLSLERSASNGSSHFLEKEYNIVQRIISDTKELKSIKVKENINKENPKKDARRQIPCRYKDPEEYHEEILELKKVVFYNMIYLSLFL